MVRWPRFLAMMLPIAAVGCSPSDTQYYRFGVGTVLSDPSAAGQTEAQDQYVALICRQAGSPDGSCAVDWNTFVQAGMNDLDQRCDGYLAWLDNRRRSVGPILQEIGDAQTTAAALLLATGSGAAAIGIAAAAFGFARDSFNNANSRLLFEVNHSTVQAIVLANQTRLRTEMRGKVIASRPQAIYALRQYLRVCMPFTIETEINNTLTTFIGGGAPALDTSNRAPLIDTRTIGTPVAPRTAVAPRAYRVPPIASAYAQLIEEGSTTYDERYLAGVLAALCISTRELNELPQAVARIKAYQQRSRAGEADALATPTGRLTAAEITRLASAPACDRSRYLNYFEAITFAGQDINTAPYLLTAMNAHLPAGRKLAANASVAEVRSRIADVRVVLRSRLQLHDAALSNQFTLDLVNILGE